MPIIITHLAPKIILLVWLFAGFTIHVANHGRPARPYNGWAALVVMIAELTLLWWSGWFTS